MSVDDPLEPALTEESESTQKAAGGRGLAALALLLALTALGGSGWLWWNDYRERKQTANEQTTEAGRIGELEASIDRRLQRLESDLAAVADRKPDARVAALEDRLQALESDARTAQAFRTERTAWSRTLQASLEDYNARLSGLEARLDALAARGMDAESETDLAELDYLLRLAQERLELFRDVRTADRALALADAHVASFDNPMFSGLRREIAAARRALAVVDMPDPAALDRELDSIQQRLPDLPFRGAELDTKRENPGDQGGWWARLKSVFSSLVTVRRTNDDSARLPALADQELIRQRAWLEIERVRLAAMRHDADAYAAAIKRARETIERWFEPQDRGTRAVLQALESAARLEVDPDLPDISTPWSALRALRGTGVAAPPIEPARRAGQASPDNSSSDTATQDEPTDTVGKGDEDRDGAEAR